MNSANGNSAAGVSDDAAEPKHSTVARRTIRQSSGYEVDALASCAEVTVTVPVEPSL
jgi:hypothetical protein